MSNEYEIELVQGILENIGQFYVAVAGGGVRALDCLFETPGISEVMVGARILYAPSTLEEYIGYKPLKSVSRQTSIAIAMAALSESRRNGGRWGVGVTSALATSRERHGEDHAWISVATNDNLYSTQLRFNKSESRETQEILLSQGLLRTMATPGLWIHE